MPYIRKRNLFDPTSQAPFQLSRSKLESFLECPRCFYLDRRLGVKQPGIYSFSLNLAVDHLLKKEFDIHRAKQQPHPLMRQYGVDAVPFRHPNLAVWRENFKGIRFLHTPTNFIITGAPDDIWINPQEQLIIVDYKATSTNEPIDIESESRRAYRRQLEIYQWLLRRNGFSVSDTGYFVYVNGRKDLAAFDGKLEFEVNLIPCTGDDSWIEEAIFRAHECLLSSSLPPEAPACQFCAYRAAAVRTGESKPNQQPSLF